MIDKKWKKFIEKAEKEYSCIGSVPCPAFNSEKIVFNKYGFQHLTWKGSIPRTRTEQTKRLALLPCTIKILRECNHASNFRESFLEKSKVYFWAITGHASGKNIRIIIRKKNNGPLHFFSVMEN